MYKRGVLPFVQLLANAYVTFSGSQLGQSDSSKILTGMYNMLHYLVKCVESTEWELKQMKETITSSSSESRPKLTEDKSL